MQWYPWLEPLFKEIITNYRNGLKHYVFLIKTLPGMGDDSLIYTITRFLMCQKPSGYKSCRKCRSCQLMKSGMHPDYYVPRIEKGKTAIGIDTMRSINEKLYEHACLHGQKVVWIHDIFLMTEEATNSILKILEEPPEKTWFFLSYYESGNLLSTLRSRCYRYHLSVPQEKWALDWLQRKIRVSQDAALAALRLCSGAPVAALEMLQKSYWTQRLQLCSALENALKNHDWLILLKLLNHEHATMYLQWLIALLLDVLKLQHGITVITNVDLFSVVSNLTGFLTSAILFAIIHTLCQCRRELLTIIGLNRELILTDRLLIIENYLEPESVLPLFHL